MDAAPDEDNAPRTKHLGLRVSPTWMAWWKATCDSIVKRSKLPRQTLNTIVLDELAKAVDNIDLRARLISPDEEVRTQAIAEHDRRKQSHHGSIAPAETSTPHR